MRIDEMARALRAAQAEIRELKQRISNIPARLAASGGGGSSLPKGQRGMVLQIIDDNGNWDAEYITMMVFE